MRPPLPRRTLLPVIWVTFAAGLLALRPAPVAPPAGPALVVMLTVDQMRGDYLARFQGQWRGGFRRLLDAGAVFPNGLQDHAITETAPGHSTLLSGRDPAHTGIIVNSLGVQDSSVELVGMPGSRGASPHRFQGTTLVDWMQRRDPGFRFLAVSDKDRAAMLPVGRARGPVFWDVGGTFTTSTYYSDTLPTWLRAWQARRGAARLAGTSWTLLRPESEYPEADAQPWEHDGADYVFPHRLPDDSLKVAQQLASYPWMDSLTLDLALDGARAMGLGQRATPDMLVIGLSATDYIGHRYGPDSREIHDHLLRLDLWLGTFLDSLRTQVGGRPILLALSADHGVTSFPEFARTQGRPGGRIGLGALVREVNRALASRLQDSTVLEESSGLIFGDRARLRAAGVSPESLATALAARVWRMPGVQNAWTPATLEGAAVSDLHARRWVRLLPPKFAWFVAAQAKPGYIWADGPGYATHGTTNPDDVNVPLVFYGPGIRPGVYPDTVRTVDIAPTLARLLRVPTQGKLDGRPIRRVTD